MPRSRIDWVAAEQTEEFGKMDHATQLIIEGIAEAKRHTEDKLNHLTETNKKTVEVVAQ